MTSRGLSGHLIVVLSMLALANAPSARAAVILLVDDDADGTLASLAGDGNCQLREAIAAADTNVREAAEASGTDPAAVRVQSDGTREPLATHARRGPPMRSPSGRQKPV